MASHCIGRRLYRWRAEGRYDCCIACLLSFLWRRVLEPAGQLPWRLCRGDIESNLRALAAEEDEPEEPCSRQFWLLLNREVPYPVVRLVKTVELLCQISWSILPAKQQRGSLAALHRWRPYYEMETFVPRAMCHQLIRMLPSESHTDRQISKTVRHMKKLEQSASAGWSSAYGAESYPGGREGSEGTLSLKKHTLYNTHTAQPQQWVLLFVW